TENQLALQIYLTTMKYKTGEIYTFLKGPLLTVPWAKIVWISYGIPRQSFLTWLVLLNRCPTRDRLNGWGLNVDPICLLCNADQESRNHLFFECGYSASVWRQIAYRCDLQVTSSWGDTVALLQDLRTSRDARRLALLATQAVIYWLWSERNGRLHRQAFKPSQTIISLVDKQIRNRLQSLRQSNPRASSAMSQLWFLRS
ncbi:unnamed protein product, partial [Brassica rapa subsp. trilocularis]